MTRQRMLFMVFALTILAGFASIWSFLSPIFDPNKPNVLNPVQLIFGTLFLLIGGGLFRRNEFALELGFWLWFISLVQHSLATVFLLAEISDFAALRNILRALFLLLLLAVQVFVVIFLSQKETKKLFLPDSAEKDEVTNE